MSKIWDSEYSIQKEILNAIGGDATKKYDSPYEIQLAILDTIEGGGSGATYTAGTGITIDAENKISVDPAVVQNKLTAGDGIEISGNTISATGGGGSGATYTAGTGITIDAENKISVDPAVVQNKLTAGEGIEISGDTISATGGAAIEDVDVLPDPEENKDKIVRLSTDGKLYYVNEVKAIKFTAREDGSSTLGLWSISSNQKLEYSTDGVKWNDMTTSTSINFASGASVYVRGILSADNSTSNFTHFKSTGNTIKVSGNINTLFDYTANDLGANFPLKKYCGYMLFGSNGTFARNSNVIYDASELIMPSVNLAEGCYRTMFNGDDFDAYPLQTPPILPATILVKDCYNDMFFKAKKLQTLTCLAVDTSASGCVNRWMGNAASTYPSTGTFYKNPEKQSWSGSIPPDWTVEDYTGETPSVEITYDSVWKELIPETLKAGTNISIVDNNISAVGYTAGTNGSFATGDRNQATNIYSHAEGTQTKATGAYSHSEGNQTRSDNFYSHAEGEGTYAKGMAAHAEGDSTSATTHYSHTEGHSTIVSNKWEHAEGQYNNSHNVNDTYGNSGNTQHSVGIGGYNNRKNAFEIMQNGDIYAYGVGGYVGTNTKAQDASIKTLQEAIPVIVRCTQAEYEQLTPDANTIYLIVSE